MRPIICSVVHVARSPISMVGDGLDSGENIYPNFPDFNNCAFTEKGKSTVIKTSFSQ